MKTLHAMLITLFAFVVWVAPAAAQIKSWDNQINRPARFTVLSDFASAAVLDRETGLVWEQAPSTLPYTPEAAHVHCNTQNVSNRKGWRLPTIQELASLVDQTQVTVPPTLPSGHPFSNVQVNDLYWSATSGTPGNPNWSVDFSNGNVFQGGGGTPLNYAWCVRGGQGVDPQ